MIISPRGTTIDGTTTSVYRHMLDMLNHDFIGLGQLWSVSIHRDDIAAIYEQISGDKGIRGYEDNQWGKPSSDSLSQILSPTGWIGDTYYVFAQSATFIGDGIKFDRPSILNSGYPGGVIGTGRITFSEATITLLEAEHSLADAVFRPWSILVGHRSLKDISLRKNFTVVQWAKDPNVSTNLIQRKSITMRHAAPLSISVEELQANSDGPILRQIRFAYDSYYVNT